MASGGEGVGRRGVGRRFLGTLQNELAAAYNELREEMAQKRYAKSFKDLSDAAQDEIKVAWPQKISEAEPVEL